MSRRVCTNCGIRSFVLMYDNRVVKPQPLSSTADSKEEKLTRAALKSAVERHTTRERIVILDSMNYIKGYRYELYCVSRAHSSSRCTVRARRGVGSTDETAVP